MKTRRNLAVIVASGQGTRMKSDLPKQFMELLGKPLLFWTISCFERSRLIDEIILVVPEDYLAYTSQAVVDKFGFRKINKITTGGETRQESALAGLTACPRATDKVAIHDGVRPFVRDTLIDSLFELVTENKAVIPAVRARETVKFVDDKMMARTLPRDRIYLAQTPQVFHYLSILEIHRKAAEEEYEATDDAMLAEQYGMDVEIIEGHYDNIKITTPEDLALAKEILKQW
jgi:2-C-methyl-D-erythritol 4-phosphate cytidylyltransferase